MCLENCGGSLSSDTARPSPIRLLTRLWKNSPRSLAAKKPTLALSSGRIFIFSEGDSNLFFVFQNGQIRVFTQARASLCENSLRDAELKAWPGKSFPVRQGSAFVCRFPSVRFPARDDSRGPQGRTKKPPPAFQLTAAISCLKLTRFSTRFRLYTSVIRLHSVRTFASPFNKKCV